MMAISPPHQTPSWEKSRSSKALFSKAFPLLTLHTDSPIKEPKVAVIREELVALTGDPFIAVILNQLLYWTQRVKDCDLFLEEEKNLNLENKILPCHGWIYKTAHELIDETMLCISRFTIRRYLGFLVENCWLYERADPTDRWNKTMQYRVNLQKLKADLYALGYHAFEELILSSVQNEHPNAQPELLKEQIALSNVQTSLSEEICEPSEEPSAPSTHEPNFSNVQIAPSREQTARSNVATCSFEGASPNIRECKNEHSNVENCSFIYLNRDYSENTNREHTQDAGAREEKNFCSQKDGPPTERLESSSLLEEMLELWRKHVGQDVALTKDRHRHLYSIFPLYFQSDIRRWEQFCERIKSSPFLMGQGPRKWHVTLDWILEEANLIKVLEGNFDDPTLSEQRQEHASQSNKEQERSELLASIEDPSWKYWCTQLSRSDRQDPLSLYELKEIISAKFAEFDGKLVWIEAEDTKTLDRIESLRLKLLTVVQKTFPKARNIRTQLTSYLPVVPSEGQQSISMNSQ